MELFSLSLEISLSQTGGGGREKMTGFFGRSVVFRQKSIECFFALPLESRRLLLLLLAAAARGLFFSSAFFRELIDLLRDPN